MRNLYAMLAALACVSFAACSGDDDNQSAGVGAAAGGGAGSSQGGGSGGSGAGTGGSSAGAGGSGAKGGGGGASGAGGAGAGGAAGGATYGQTYEGGQFHLGPVDFSESQWHNACAPGTKYAQAVQQAEGDLLAGLWNGIPNVSAYCDACIFVKTAMGKSAVLRVVTYGDTTMNSIDVSPAAYDILNSGEYPRAMTWQFTECPDTGKVMYEFQTGSNEWWTSLWVRNARVPLSKVEVKSPNHADFAVLDRGSDGTLTDQGGFGNGTFSIRLTGIDNSTITDTFTWPASGIAGAFLTGQGNFQ